MNIKKKLFRLSYKSLLYIFVATLLISPIYAETLNSNDYTIEGAIIDSSGEASDSGLSTYSILSTVGDFSGVADITSTNYTIGTGNPEVFTANVPKISCFETTTNGTSQCISGPVYLNTSGMITICGESGCYDRSRFEIDTQNNPIDTKYSIQISTDNFSSDIQYVDWTSRFPSSIALITIDDYKTQNEWEDYNNSYSTGWTNSYNVKGLVPNTQYWIRATALHGDFTESSPGPSLNTTTAIPTLSLDIDIADTSGTAAETPAPNELSLFLVPGSVVTADNLIWLDMGTNGQGGLALSQKGLYGGLDSGVYLISSATTDLASAGEGFGLQDYYNSEEYVTPNGDLTVITPSANYAGSAENVGIISTSAFDTYTSTGPVYNGRAGMYVKGKSQNSTPSGSYSETITFILLATY